MKGYNDGKEVYADLYSVSGVKVFERDLYVGNDLCTLALSGLRAGIYFVKVLDAGAAV